MKRTPKLHFERAKNKVFRLLSANRNVITLVGEGHTIDYTYRLFIRELRKRMRRLMRSEYVGETVRKSFYE